MMNKTAFFEGFRKRRAERLANEAHMGFNTAWSNIHEMHPLPKKTVAKWHAELDKKKGIAEGYNHFSDQFNAWLPTPEGNKWNDAQAAKFNKGSK